MHRRQFIEGALGATVLAAWQARRGASSNAAPPPIPGADPTGVLDSTIAFQKLISTLPQVNAWLRIPPGTYRFGPDRKSTRLNSSHT